MLGPTDGSAQGGLGKTHKLIGGETVFGFFLDGDDAQQPVIVGSIYRNANVESFDIDEIAFKPFSGHVARKGAEVKPRVVQGPTKQTPRQATQTSPTDKSGNIIGGRMKSPTASILSKEKPGADKFFPVDKALAIAYETASRPTIISENGCDDNVIGKITRAIQNFIAVVNGLESYLDAYIDPILNTFVDITTEIRRTARIITGAVKFLINNMRNIIMKMVGCLFSKFVGLVVPIPQQAPIGEATKNILNIIFCLFEKIIDLLLPFLEDMLRGLVGRAINAPLCAIEEFTATILNKIIDIIDDLLEPILSGLDWLLNGLSQVKSILSRAVSIATQVFNLIGCDNLKCNTPSEWALAVGPSKASYDNWNGVVSKMNVIRGFNDSLELSVNSLSIYGTGASIFRDCANRVNNPQSQKDLVNTSNRFVRCIPPEIEIYGDGVGAQAIAVVGNNGSILSIEILNPGYGYTKAPTINIVDKTNYGTGARASAAIRNGRLSEIYLLSSGSGYCDTNLNRLFISPYYLIVADRYSFYEGETVTFTILTENVTDGTVLTYQIGGEITQDDIEGPISGNITIFNSRAAVKVKTRQDSARETLEQLNFDLLNFDNQILARAVVIINDRSSPILQFEPPNPVQSPPGTTIPLGTGVIPTTPGISTFFQNIPEIGQGDGTSVVVGGGGLEISGGVGGVGIPGGVGGTGIPGGVSGAGTGLPGGTEVEVPTTIIGGVGGTGLPGEAGETGIPAGGVGGTGIPGGTGLSGGTGGLETITLPIGISTVITVGVETPVITERPNVGILTGIVITNPGTGYTPGDTISVGSGTSQCIITPVVSPNGSIVGVQSVFCPIEFSILPDLIIDSSEGEGAELYPVLRYNSKADVSTLNIAINEVGVIKVVDCI